jgi:hypothetical protein
MDRRAKGKDSENDEYVLNESDARIWRAFREPLPAKTDLASPMQRGMVLDRDGKEINPQVLPHVPGADSLVAGGLNDGIDASRVADFIHRDTTGKKLPDDWQRIDHSDNPDLHADMEKAGAYHLVSPSGMQYIAFGSSEKKSSPLESLKQAFGLSSKASAAARIGRAFDTDYQVTYAGIGRGGALAKIGSEAASTWVANAGDTVRPKTCIAIDATSVPPLTYRALGLAEKGHARTTVAISRTTDAQGKYRREFAKSNDVRVQERAEDRTVVGGPRGGQRRDVEASTRFDVTEHTAHTDLKIKLAGAIKIGEQAEFTSSGRGEGSKPVPHPAANIQGYVRDDMLRKHLLAASRGENTKGARYVGRER